MPVPDYDLIFATFVAWLPELAGLAKAVVFPAALFALVPFLAWGERRGAALMQDRLDPDDAAPSARPAAGLRHLVADIVNCFAGETAAPADAGRAFRHLAPGIMAVAPLVAWCAIPVASPFELFGRTVTMQIAPVESGALFLLAVSSLAALGILFAGCASGCGAARSAATQAFARRASHEVPVALALLGAATVYGTLDLNGMVRAQERLLFGILPAWGVVVQPLGFAVLLVAALARCDRLPVDPPAGGPGHIGRSPAGSGGIHAAMFRMADHLAMMTASALIATVFFGGYAIPWVDSVALAGRIGSIPASIVHLGFFLLKTGMLLMLFLLIRHAPPRFRPEAIAALAWRRLVPLGLANLFATAALLSAIALAHIHG